MKRHISVTSKAIAVAALAFAFFLLKSNENLDPVKTSDVVDESAAGERISEPALGSKALLSATPKGATLRSQKSELTAVFLKTLFSSTPGSELIIPLPDGRTASGTVSASEFALDLLPDAGYIQGRLTEPQPGFFFFQKQSMPGVAGDVVGAIRFDAGDLAYRVDRSPSRPVLALHVVDDVFCASLAAPPAPAEAAELPAEHPDAPAPPTYQNGVIPLQSLPGAVGVIYLDYDGETGPHGGWGDFDAEAPAVTSAQIREVWERVAEDFAPFNLNVTTDLQVYLDAPENSRQRCIVTPTKDAAPNVGGIAYLESFNWTGDTPCWAFYASGKSSAEIISHEIGHTLGLSHDGRTIPAEGYYGGHGEGDVGWAPIMGTGYNKNLSQFSKGEYLDASQTQDDLFKITQDNNNIDYRSDDHGAALANASHLHINPDGSVDSDGVIETSIDVDAFKFTLATAATVTLTASPVSAGPNLDLYAELFDSSGSPIISDNPQTGVSASITTTLAPGVYSLQVSGTGLGDPLADGFSDYGSLGFYQITGTVPNSELPDRFDIAENSPLDTAIGTVTPRDDHGGASLVYSITSGNAMFGIDSATGTLKVADAAQFDFESWTPGYESPEFELSVTIAEDPANPSADESIRVVVRLTDVNEAPAASNSALTMLENTAPGTLLTEIEASDPDYGDVVSYSITAGDPGGVFAIDASSGAISVAGAVTSTTQLTIGITDAGSPQLADSVTVDITVVPVSGSYSAGSIRQTFFEGIAGSELDDLTDDDNFPNQPGSERLLSEFNSGSHGDDFGSTIRGYLIPPASGDYTFWLASDDEGELRLSTSSNPAGADIINSVSGFTNPQEWITPSAPVSLLAGEAYYIELRYKEDAGADHASVAWQGPGISQQVIPGAFLAPYYQNYAPYIGSTSFSVRANSYPNTVLGNLVPNDVNAGDTHSQFTILSGNEAGIFSLDPITGTLKIATFGIMTVGSDYVLDIEFTDSGTPALTSSDSLTISATAPNTFDPGGIVQEIWDAIPGSDIVDLTSDPRYPAEPSSTRVLQGFDSGSDIANDYGSRIRAYVVPTTTGDYTFYLSTDDAGKLLLSSDNTPAAAVEIASVTGWADPGVWDKFPSQKSAPVSLVAGEHYYIETLQKDGGGGDHVQVAWTGPGSTEITVIDDSSLLPFNGNVGPLWDAQNYYFSVDLDDPDGTAVGTVSASDIDIVHYTILSGNSSGAFAIDPDSGEISVADQGPEVVGQVLLLIGAQDGGSDGIYPPAATNTTVTITVTSGGNRAPRAFNTGYNLPSNSAPGTVVGTAFAFDTNAGDTLFYTLDTSSPFEIDLLSGRLTLADPLLPGVPSYSLPYTVTDAGGLSDEATLTVIINVPYDSDADGLPDTWETAHFGDTSSNDGTGDPDKDQLTNFHEMAFGTNPTLNNTSDQSATETTRAPGSNLVEVRYRRPKDFFDSGLSYQVHTSTDLIGWPAATTMLVSIIDDPDGMTEWVTESITTSEAALFTKVIATQTLDDEPAG